MTASAQAAESTEIIARAVICRDDRLLVVRLVAKRWFFLPGGHVEPGERVQDALLREVDEELGATATVAGFLGVVEHGYVEDGVPHHELNFVFEVRVEEEDLSSREDHIESFWVSLSELPEVDLRPRAVRDALIAAGAGTSPFWHPWDR